MMIFCLHACGVYGFFKYSLRIATQVECAVRAVKCLLNAAQHSCVDVSSSVNDWSGSDFYAVQS